MDLLKKITSVLTGILVAAFALIKSLAAIRIRLEKPWQGSQEQGADPSPSRSDAPSGDSAGTPSRIASILSLVTKLLVLGLKLLLRALRLTISVLLKLVGLARQIPIPTRGSKSRDSEPTEESPQRSRPKGVPGVGLVRRLPFLRSSRTTADEDATDDITETEAPTEAREARERRNQTPQVDVLRRIAGLRYRLSTQLFAAFGVAVALTVAASIIGWFSFDQVDAAQQEVNEGSIPEMETAFGVADYSSGLGAAASRLTAASNSIELEDVWVDIVAARERFQVHLDELENTDRARSQQVRIYSEALETYVQTIRETKEVGFELDEKADVLLDEMIDIRASLDSVLIPAVDDELFYMSTGRAQLGDIPAAQAVHFSEERFRDFRFLSDLNALTNIALQQLSSVFSIFDPTLVEAQEERFESSIAAIDRSLESLSDEALRARLEPLYEDLKVLGVSREGIFLILRSRLLLNQEQAVLLDLSRQQTVSLNTVVDGLVDSATISAEEATVTSEEAISTGKWLLVAISAVSFITAVLISWLFVGRVILSRINNLSFRMRGMAAGQLEEEVEVRGRDEVAEMAAALEVFRHNSQEALRLNLVEQLNTELEGKNDELQKVLNDLETAQDQIVMREKLAALGEVTAGVAHEIRNPLNFVKNFSELSEELLQEMNEAIEDDSNELDISLISDISKDLVENLERIRHHSDRANRIVNDMLSMGRGTTSWQEIELNTLLAEHAMLAYHSARANDTEFQLSIEQDLDPEIGTMVAIPQDLGRTFLNIVGNACQATDERRRALQEEGIGFEGYSPTVWLTTKSLGEEVEIRIKDNGPGIPDDVIEKIFNPFFTTKPTNKGTGLGLAITSDIIRQHGGTIQVESVPGEFTEMQIVIPRQPPDEVALHDASGDDSTHEPAVTS